MDQRIVPIRYLLMISTPPNADFGLVYGLYYLGLTRLWFCCGSKCMPKYVSHDMHLAQFIAHGKDRHARPAT